MGARVQRNSSTVMRVWKQCSNEHRTTGSGRLKLPPGNRSSTTGVLMSASSIRRPLLRRGLRPRVTLYRILLTANHQRLRLQGTHELRAWEVNWHQVVFSDESRFNFWDHDGRIRDRRYAGARCLPECSGLAIHQNDHQARRRFVEWAQNEIAVVPDFHKRILFSDKAHFWLNGYVNKQNCRIWSEVNPQVYVETPLHPEKLTVWCALWAGGILLQKR
ncbi:transposable element Tc1 transposase [Trichonephila clavipes]|nr:transposable element Tc1 transposase [Trichonephila clavipes]